MTASLLLAVATVAAEQAGNTGVGRAIYLRQCASCHGEAATGYGPARSILREPPADLTELSGRDRPFESQPIRNHVTGRVRREPYSGPSEMPKWRDAADSDLNALMAYLESVQRVPYGPFKGITIADQAKMGATVFKQHCVSCHGVDGRGPGPSGYIVGAAIPDLTSIASRQGGTIDMRRLYETIARCGGDEDPMPAWEHVLRRRGWLSYLVMKDLENVAWYVESLQQR